jgi:hypothetical protein
MENVQKKIKKQKSKKKSKKKFKKKISKNQKSNTFIGEERRNAMRETKRNKEIFW